MSGRHRIVIVGVGKRQEGINKIGYSKWINDKKAPWTETQWDQRGT